MDNGKIADVLEEAARLYKDEKVEWCTGHWLDAETFVADGIGNLVPDESGALSMCAEGALLQASGMSLDGIHGFSFLPVDLEREYIKSKASSEVADLFIASRDALSQYLLAHRQENYVCNTAIEHDESRFPVSVAVVSWNDDMITKIISSHDPSDAKQIAKSTVISAMEATAKDLRNG